MQLLVPQTPSDMQSIAPQGHSWHAAGTAVQPPQAHRRSSRTTTRMCRSAAPPPPPPAALAAWAARRPPPTASRSAAGAAAAWPPCRCARPLTCPPHSPVPDLKCPRLPPWQWATSVGDRAGRWVQPRLSSIEFVKGGMTDHQTEAPVSDGPQHGMGCLRA